MPHDALKRAGLLNDERCTWLCMSFPLEILTVLTVGWHLKPESCNSEGRHNLGEVRMNNSGEAHPLNEWVGGQSAAISRPHSDAIKADGCA